MKTHHMLILQYFNNSRHIIKITHFHVEYHEYGYYEISHTYRHGISLNLDLSLILMASLKTCLFGVILDPDPGQDDTRSGELCNSTMKAMSQTGVLMTMQLSVLN